MRSAPSRGSIPLVAGGLRDPDTGLVRFGAREEGEAYAATLDTVLGVGLAASTYFPEQVFKPKGDCNGVSGVIEGVWDSEGLLPDFIREHPGFPLGRFGSSAAMSYALSPAIGLSITALSMYGSGIQAAQTGNNVLHGIIVGAH